MAKIKNRKRISADTIHKRKESLNTKKSMNPFEVHINKEKLRVLGKKTKNDKGLPGVSRAKAIQKRKHTLLLEYKYQNKTNQFVDKRIGEKSRDMSEEEKALVRFTAVRAKAHKKKSIFNLADDEVLTHRGQTITEIEKFDDPRSDNEESDDENKSGKLGKDFVGDAHFGGGILRNTGKEGAKTHKELIEQLIEESKKRKAEKQKVKEATLELTEKLDSEWKDLLPLVNKSNKKEALENNVKTSHIDDYDKVMRELRFEARGTVSDRLKTEEEIAAEQKQKLEQLEKERLERMKGISDDKPRQQNHRSADDLDDEFVYDSDPEQMLTYNTEGESNVKVEAEINGKKIGENLIENSENEGDEESEDANSDENEDSAAESESEDNLSDLKESSSESDDEADQEEFEKTEVPNNKSSELSTQPNLNDVPNKKQKVEEGQESIQVENKGENNKLKRKSSLDDVLDKKQKTEKQSNSVAENDGLENKSELQDKIKADLLERKKIMEQARRELPYTFSLPDSYESFQNVFHNYSSYHQSVIIERMIKCNHPSLSEGNKEGLGNLFAYLLQYLNDVFTDEEDSIEKKFDVFKALVPQIFELALLDKENTHNSILEVMKEKHQEYKKRKKDYPGLEILIFLKLISILFSTSDFRHQIVTPSLVFIEQMLMKCKVRTKRDISYGLFLVALVLEYTNLSKRYLPAAINFLSGLIHMAIPKTSVKLIKVLPPFKAISTTLVLIENCDTTSLQMSVQDLNDANIDNNYKVRVLNTTLLLLQEYFELYKELSSSVEIFQQVEAYLLQIPIENYPKTVRDQCEKLLSIINQLRKERKLTYIVMEAKKPKALRLYEPKFEAVFDYKKRKVQSRDKAEHEKLLHKLKKETKGALREIRRDRSFLGRVKINQKIQSDKERKEKVNKLFAEASLQQSELKALDRMKKKK